jgi:hypothetical protein
MGVTPPGAPRRGRTWSGQYTDPYADVGSRYPWGDTPWPGTDAPAPGTPLVVDRERLKTIARSLARELAVLTSGRDSAQDHLARTGDVTAPQVGSWPAGRQFHRTLVQANGSLTDAHLAFLRTYKDVIDKVLIAAGIYDDAEDSTCAYVAAIEKRAGLGDQYS